MIQWQSLKWKQVCGSCSTKPNYSLEFRIAIIGKLKSQCKSPNFNLKNGQHLYTIILFFLPVTNSAFLIKTRPLIIDIQSKFSLTQVQVDQCPSLEYLLKDQRGLRLAVRPRLSHYQKVQITVKAVLDQIIKEYQNMWKVDHVVE